MSGSASFGRLIPMLVDGIEVGGAASAPIPWVEPTQTPSTLSGSSRPLDWPTVALFVIAISSVLVFLSGLIVVDIITLVVVEALTLLLTLGFAIATFLVARKELQDVEATLALARNLIKDGTDCSDHKDRLRIQLPWLENAFGGRAKENRNWMTGMTFGGFGVVAASLAFPPVILAQIGTGAIVAWVNRWHFRDLMRDIRQRHDTVRPLVRALKDCVQEEKTKKETKAKEEMDRQKAKGTPSGAGKPSPETPPPSATPEQRKQPPGSAGP